MLEGFLGNWIPAKGVGPWGADVLNFNAAGLGKAEADVVPIALVSPSIPLYLYQLGGSISTANRMPDWCVSTMENIWLSVPS